MAVLPRMMAEIIRRRMKTYSSVPSEKTVSGESAVFRREAVMTGKLAGVRTVIGDAERKIRETGDRFLFLYQESRGESEVIDSSLRVTILFPVFPSRHFCHRLE